MAIDLETVTLQGTYRIGFMPPAEHSLAAGELYIEVGQGAPKLWVGAVETAGLVGNMAVFATAEAAPLVPPVNRDVPLVWQEGAFLTCTMGNWNGAPETYAYQWKLDGVTDVGDGTASYTFVPADVGKTATCIVSATNAAGTTAAPPSNGVLIAPPAEVAHGFEAAGQALASAPAEPTKEEPKPAPAPEPTKEEPKPAPEPASAPAPEPHSKRNRY